MSYPAPAESEPTPNQPAEKRSAAVYRILDANANRAGEGLRVAEDYFRFCRQDAFLSRTCKQLRHDLATAMAAIPSAPRLAARSTLTDVGTRTSTQAEYERSSMFAVAQANLRRAAEALRTLEEYSKLLSNSQSDSSGVGAAQTFESLRYQLYTLEKSLTHSQRGNQRLSNARLYVLADLSFGLGYDFTTRIEALLGSADVIQLRDKQATDRQLVEAGQLLRTLTRNTDTLFVMNDRPDIACLTQADGIHVGQEEIQVPDVRSIVGPDMLIGMSTHSLEQAQQAVLQGADYIGVGPVFESKTKEFKEFVGLGLVQQLTGEIGIPMFSIGGIDLARLDTLLDAGAERVAVSSAIWQAADGGKLAKQFRDRLYERNAPPQLTD